MAVQRDDKAKTMVSTAENQKVSVKVKASAPTSPAPKTCNCFARSASTLPPTSFFASAVIVQNKNIMVAPLANADIKLVQYATLALLPKESSENALPSMANKG